MISAVIQRLAALGIRCQKPAAGPDADVELSESDGASRRAWLPKPKNILAAAAAVMASVLVAAGLAGGTYASLNSQAQTSAVTISSGSLQLTFTAGGATSTTVTVPSAAWGSMLPGDFVSQSFFLQAAGNVPFTLTWSLAQNTPWDIRVVGGPCPNTLLTIAPLTTTPMLLNATFSPGLATNMCIQASLPANAPATAAGTTSNLTIIATANQVTS
jgi:hypothetical protein